MLKFRVFDNGKPAEKFPLRNAYMIGPDCFPVRGSVKFDNGLIVCDKKEPSVVGLALQHRVGNCGEITLQTTRLPERDEPYLLNMELARHRLMLLYAKLEEWAKFDMAADHPAIRRAEVSRKLFVEALCHQRDNPVRAEKLARDSLEVAVDGSEELALSHSELMLNRRKVNPGLPKRLLGTTIAIDETSERYRKAIAANFDFAILPLPWKRLVVEEGDYRFDLFDNWIEWAQASNVALIGGPLISFDTMQVPEWLFIWEHDYDTVRELVYEHVERIVTRYKGAISTWNVVSGLHVNSQFSFNLDQLMDLTRMATMLVKKIQPGAQVQIEIRQPFGEYFSSNLKSTTPQIYADQIVQRQIGFDVLSIKYLMGQAVPGQYSRDLMQFTNFIDQFSGLGKPIHLTLGVPSEPVTSEMIAVPEFTQPVDPNAGFWRGTWSQKVQRHWFEAACQIAISKPYIETVAWSDFIDHPQMEMPLAGFMTVDFQPKALFKHFVLFKRNLQNPPPADFDLGQPHDADNGTPGKVVDPN
jgi:hypothetical protein